MEQVTFSITEIVPSNHDKRSHHGRGGRAVDFGIRKKAGLLVLWASSW